MQWLLFALLAPAVLTITNFTDKYVIGNAMKDFRGLVILQSIMGFIVGTIFWIATGFPILNFWDSIVILWTGILSTWGTALYFKVLKEEDTSYVIFMFQLVPMFVIVLSWLILHETISLKQFAGFTLILLSSLAISLGGNRKLLRFSKSFGLLLIMDLLFALVAVLVTFAIEVTSFSQMLSYESWGVGLGGLFLYIFLPKVRYALNDIIRSVRKKILAIMFVNEGIYVLSKSLSYFAFSLGPVALVSVVGSTQVFMGVVAGWLLTLLFPKVFKESITKKDLVKKLVVGVILMGGIMLIF